MYTVKYNEDFEYWIASVRTATRKLCENYPVSWHGVATLSTPKQFYLVHVNLSERTRHTAYLRDLDDVWRLWNFTHSKFRLDESACVHIAGGSAACIGLVLKLKHGHLLTQQTCAELQVVSDVCRQCTVPIKWNYFVPRRRASFFLRLRV